MDDLAAARAYVDATLNFPVGHQTLILAGVFAGVSAKITGHYADATYVVQLWDPINLEWEPGVWYIPKQRMEVPE